MIVVPRYAFLALAMAVLAVGVSVVLEEGPQAQEQCLDISPELRAQQSPLEARAACEEALQLWRMQPSPEDDVEYRLHQFERLLMKMLRANTFVRRAELSDAIAAMEEIAWDPYWDFGTPSPSLSDLRWLLLLTDRYSEAVEFGSTEPLNTDSPAMIIAANADVLVYIFNGEIESAKAVLDTAQQAYSREQDYYFEPELLSYVGVTLDLAQGDYKRAKSSVEQEIGIGDEGQAVRRWYAIALRELGLDAEALKATNESLKFELNSEDRLKQALAYMTVALTKLRVSDDPKAVASESLAAADAAIDRVEGIAISRFLKAAMQDLRGRALLAGGDTEGALRGFLVATELEPYLVGHYIDGIQESSGILPDTGSPISGQVEQVLQACLTSGCVPPEPRRCDYDGPGIACVPVRW